MSQLTLDLPESLYQQLAEQAQREGVSLQHYVIYTLTRMFTAVDLAEQRAAFENLLSQYPVEQAEASLRELLSRRQPIP
jgi:hypothetical protein